MQAGRGGAPDLWRHVVALAGPGPRPAGSAAERRAQAYAAARLRAAGARVNTEAFATAPTFTWMWLAVAGLLLVAALAPWLALPGWAGALAGGLGAVGFWGIGAQNLPVYRLLPMVPSQNVVGRLAPRGAVRRRAVLVAHADSTRAALLFAPAQVRHFGRNFGLNLAAGALAALAAAGWWLAPHPGWRWLALPALVPLAYGAGVLIHRELCCRWVQGANDNASGVAVTLGLVEHLARHPLEQTEVWAVITGAEEVGFPTGAICFRDRHRADLRRAAILVIDNVGRGDLRYLTGEGSFRFHRAAPALLALARDLCARHPQWRGAPGRVPRGSYTDAHPFLAAGLPALAVWAEVDGVIPNWHWPTDVLDNVDPAALGRAWAFSLALLRELDARPAAPQG